MSARDMHLHSGRMGAALAIRVTPRASRNEISEVLNDGTIRVRLKGSGQDQDTNQALVEFLAQVLQVPADQVEIVAGLAGRDKLVSILGLDPAAAQSRILQNLA